MSETETTPTGTNALEAAVNALTGNAPEATQGEPAETDEALGEGGKKALKAEREARTAAERQAAELKARLDKIEAANMSDLERAQKEATEAKEAAAKATQDALRYRIAAESGITANAELILTASDEETMRKQAALWAERPTTTTPKPDPSQGAQHALALNSDGLTEALSRAVGARPN
jgi:hypothetical protein